MASTNRGTCSCRLRHSDRNVSYDVSFRYKNIHKTVLLKSSSNFVCAHLFTIKGLNVTQWFVLWELDEEVPDSYPGRTVKLVLWTLHDDAR